MRRTVSGLVVGVITFSLGVSAATLYLLPDAAPSANDKAAARPARTDRVILEVTRRDTISACYTDEYTELRAYESGRFEGDIFTVGSVCTPRLRSAHLDAGDLGELITLLRRPAFISVNGEYPQFAIYTDSVTCQTIRFAREGGEQKITLINPSPTNPKNKANYPPVLLDLLLKVQGLKRQLEQAG